MGRRLDKTKSPQLATLPYMLQSKRCFAASRGLRWHLEYLRHERRIVQLGAVEWIPGTDISGEERLSTCPAQCVTSPLNTAYSMHRPPASYTNRAPHHLPCCRSCPMTPYLKP